MTTRYVDDPFDDRDMSIEGQDFRHPELIEKLLLACRRTRKMFKSDPEIVKCRKVDRLYDKGKLPEEWINSRMEYARKYHWQFPVLLSAILNVGKMEVWCSANNVMITTQSEPPKMEEAIAPTPSFEEYYGSVE